MVRRTEDVESNKATPPDGDARQSGDRPFRGIVGPFRGVDLSPGPRAIRSAEWPVRSAVWSVRSEEQASRTAERLGCSTVRTFRRGLTDILSRLHAFRRGRRAIHSVV